MSVIVVSKLTSAMFAMNPRRQISPNAISQKWQKIIAKCVLMVLDSLLSFFKWF